MSVRDNLTGGAGVGGWSLRNTGLVLGQGGLNEVGEFTGMWGLRSDADLAKVSRALAARGLSDSADDSFPRLTTKLGLVRTARWFVTRTLDFPGYTLFFASQFDGTLEGYFDDFVLYGKKNLADIWGQCVGCPTGHEVGARDIVDYIARGQVKTLACYDAFPGISIGSIHKMADWYDKTQTFRRALASGSGTVHQNVDSFLRMLDEPYLLMPSDAAAIDANVGVERLSERAPLRDP